MSIPESQLATWSKQGAVTTSKSTHEVIRKALAQSEALKNKDIDVYLQGSYKNSTNIRGDSDVDVVVQLDSTFGRDLSLLTPEQKEKYESSYTNATYTWKDFRTDVLKALRDYFGATFVKEGNKSLKITGASGRLPADVIPCLQYRKYLYFYSQKNQDYVEGIKFFTQRENRLVINYPKVHYKNGTEKNGKTDENYKPLIRIVKNARSYLVSHDLMNKGIAPSYFIECLLYNVPDELYKGNYQYIFYNILEWLRKADLNQFICQNRQLDLFGNTPEQWSIENANALIKHLIELWNRW